MRRPDTLQAVTPSRKFLPDAPGVLSLFAMMTMLSALTLFGCAGNSVDQAAAGDVNNKAFAFPSGGMFHPALANLPTTLAFTNNAANFTLSSASGTATGTNLFGSCILTVATSTYNAGAGPQVNDVITLSPCDFDSDNNTLTVSHGNITATSAPGSVAGPGSS